MRLIDDFDKKYPSVSQTTEIACIISTVVGFIPIFIWIPSGHFYMNPDHLRFLKIIMPFIVMANGGILKIEALKGKTLALLLRG